MIPMRRGEGRWAGTGASELQHPRRCATKVQSVLPLKVPGHKKLSPQRSLLLPIPVSRPLVRCVICAVKSSISAVKEATSAQLTVTSLLVGRQSGVAPTLVSVSEMASSTSCTMRPSSLPQCTDFQQFALPRDNNRLSLKRACSASSFATGCAGCLQTPRQSGRIGFLATDDATNSPEACCVRLEWHPSRCVPLTLTRCACLSCQLPASLGP